MGPGDPRDSCEMHVSESLGGLTAPRGLVPRALLGAARWALGVLDVRALGTRSGSSCPLAEPAPWQRGGALHSLCGQRLWLCSSARGASGPGHWPPGQLASTPLHLIPDSTQRRAHSRHLIHVGRTGYKRIEHTVLPSRCLRSDGDAGEQCWARTWKA